MMPTPDPIQPGEAWIITTCLIAYWAIYECVRSDWVRENRTEYGSVGEGWWVDRAKRGGGGGQVW